MKPCLTILALLLALAVSNAPAQPKSFTLNSHRVNAFDNNSMLRAMDSTRLLVQ